MFSNLAQVSWLMRPAALLFASGAFSSLLFALFGDLLRSDLTPLVQDLCRFTLTEDHWQLDLRSFCIGVVVGFLMELKERQGAGHTLILALKNAFNPP